MARPRKKPSNPDVPPAGPQEVTLNLLMTPEEQEVLNHAWRAFTRGKQGHLSDVLNKESTLYTTPSEDEKPVSTYEDNLKRLGLMLVKYASDARKHELSRVRRHYQRRRAQWGVRKTKDNNIRQ